MLPFKLTPAFKDYIWGGSRLKSEYGKQSPLAVVAESWELSAHPAGSSGIAGGEFSGMSFAEFARQYPLLLGTSCQGEKFPILMKLIDARQSLSVQVHPDDAYAQRVEGEPGKTEMWVILDCKPDSFLYFGLERTASKAEVERRIGDNTLTEILHKLPVQRGDAVFVRSGTIHAIGAGIMLAEIQQSSDTTYRMYDFGRLGADGKPRQLHVEKALDVAVLGPGDPTPPGISSPVASPDYTETRLARCPHFTVDSIALTGRYDRALDGSSFVCVFCADGGGKLHCAGVTIHLRKGESLFVTADNPDFSLEGDGWFLLMSV